MRSRPTPAALAILEGQPGALELQGDHGAIEFRNIVLIPLVKRNGK
ncbi:MAG TPA: hypothetical protein VH369_08315 [Bryobacteraceae bacterium]|jgi:hypothetical protein